jgi:CheY-like chemotaxis protein
MVNMGHPNMANQNLAGGVPSRHHGANHHPKRSADVTDRTELGAMHERPPEAPENLNVLLVDDHAVMLESVRAVLETDGTLTVVGTASRVADAIDLARVVQPEVAVIDVNMPDGGGWAAARGLREVCPDIRLVAYSSFDEALVIRTIAAAGISAFVTKGSDIDLLLAAIHGENVRPESPEPKPLLGRTTAATA